LPQNRLRWVCAFAVGAVLAGCAPEVPVVSVPRAPSFNGVPPQGFGPVTMVPVAAGTYPRATAFDSGQDDLVVLEASYPLRAVAADRIRIGFSGMNVMGPDGTESFVPAPPSYTTEPALRVGGTEDKLIAVIVALAYCGRPVPDAAELYSWGDAPVMQSDDSGEWQFTGLC